MKLTRRPRSIAVLIALFCMLFMQLVVAGYVCPSLTVEPINSLVAASPSGSHLNLGGCDESELAQRNLCDAHCQVGNQSLDKADLPHAQPFVAATLTLVLDHHEITIRSAAIRPEDMLLVRETAPPIAIRNCSFQI